jgi:hypothetical protein
LLHFPGSWLAFYVLSTALLAAWYLLVVAAIEPVGLYAVLLAGPALAGVMLIYARLVGRLAWRITFIPSGAKRGKPARQEPKQPVAAGSKGKKRKKVRTLKLQLPDELDRPSVGADDGPRPPRAKLDFHKRP